MAEAPFLFYRELLPATNVELAKFFTVFNELTNNKEEFLLTITASVVNVYKLIERIYTQGDNSYENVKLSLEFSDYIYGKVHDLSIFTHRNSNGIDRDLVVVAVDIGKLIIASYNPIDHELETLFMSNGEETAIGIGTQVIVPSQGNLFNSGMPNCVRIDSENNLLCNVLYGRNLMFNSFVESPTTIIDRLANPTIAMPTLQSVANTFHCNLHIDLGLLGSILDIAFVYGYSRPAIAVLHESDVLPIGHAARVRHTNTISVLAVDAALRSLAIIWQQISMPHDSLMLLELPDKSFAGCVGLVSQNAFLVISQNGCYSVAMNGFAPVSVDREISMQPWIASEADIELESSRWIVVSGSRATNGTDSKSNNSACFASLKDGRLLKIEMVLEAEQLPSIRFYPEVLAKSAKASCFCTNYSHSYWFFGSRQADCLLFQVTYDVICEEDEADTINMLEYADSSSKKARRYSEDHQQQAEFMNAIVKEEAMLYGGDPLSKVITNGITNGVNPSSVLQISGRSNVGLLRLALAVVDTVAVLGPVLSGSFCKPDDVFHQFDAFTRGEPGERATALKNFSTAASYIADAEAKKCLQITTGLDEDASVARVYSGVRLSKLAARSFNGALSVHSIDSTIVAAMSTGVSILLLAFDAKSRVLVCVLDKKANTQTVLSMKEDTDSGFITHQRTIKTGLIHNNIVIQVAQSTVRVLEFLSTTDDSVDTDKSYNMEAAQDVLLLDTVDVGGLGGTLGEVIVQADIGGGWIVLLTNLQSLFVLQYDINDAGVALRYAYRVDDDTTASGSEIPNLREYFINSIVSVSLYSGILQIKHEQTKFSNEGITEMESETTEDEILLRKRRFEESMLYGCALDETDTEGHDSETNSPTSNRRSNNASRMNGYHMSSKSSFNSAEAVYLILADVYGNISVVNLANDKKVEDKCAQFFRMNVLGVSTTLSLKKSNGIEIPENIDDKTEVINKFVLEIKLVRLKSNIKEDATIYDSSNSITDSNVGKLTLFILYNTGELVVYSSNEYSIDGAYQLHNFFKVHQKTVFNQRLLNSKLKRGISSDSIGMEDAGNEAISDTNAMIAAFLDSVQFKRRFGNYLRHSKDFNGKDCVLVSCTNPFIIYNNRDYGLLSYKSICLPELPFVNHGHYNIAPLKVSGLNTLVSLWYEINENGNKNDISKASIVAIYHELPALNDYYYNSGLTVKKVNTSRTVINCLEIKNKTDDKIEMSLLEKRTFVMACSEEVVVPFEPKVLKDDNSERTSDGEIFYERFFESLESFCQPDVNYGLPPVQYRRQFHLTLTQDGTEIDSYEMPEYEYITSMEVVYLDIEKPNSGFSNVINNNRERRVFVIAGTTIGDPHGEDTLGAGRLLLFSLDYVLYDTKDTESDNNKLNDVVDTPNKSISVEVTNNDVTTTLLGVSGDDKDEAEKTKEHTSATKLAESKVDNKLTPMPKSKTEQDKFLGRIRPKLRLHSKAPGPASVVKAFGQYIIATVGATLYVYRVKPVTYELEQAAFFFSHFYIANVSCIKNYIIVSDMHHSISLLLWREEDASLNLISRDYDRGVYPSTQIIYDNSKLAILTGDDFGNLRLLQEDPRKLESKEGSRLLCIADFHLGSDVSFMLNHVLLTPEQSIQKQLGMDEKAPKIRRGSSFPLQPFGTRMNGIYTKKSSIVSGTMDGSLGIFIPIEEKMYKRLLLLQQLMTLTLKTIFSLNPRDFHTLKSPRIVLLKKKGFIDGRIIAKYESLPSKLQEELAQILGVTSYLIKINIREIENLSSFF